MEKLANLIAAQEERLMKILLGYALRRGYTKYTSTLEEAWRLSVSMLSKSLIDACRNWDAPPELAPELDFRADPIAYFGIVEAHKHRERGVSIEMFLGLMKYYRQSYLDIVKEAGFERTEEETCSLFINRFYDRIELGFCKEWISNENDHLISDLQAENRFMTNEKNKFLTVFESLPHPVILIDTELKIEHMNHAAMQFIRNVSTPGAHYYCAAGAEADPAENLSGERLDDLFPWLVPDVRSFAAGDAQSLTGERSVYGEKPSTCFQVKISRMLDVSEKFSGMIIALSDITEQKQAMEALREREKFIKTVLDNLPIGIAVNAVDPEVTFEYMNDNFPRLYRTTRETLMNPDLFWEAVYEEPEFREQLRRKVLADCACGDPARMVWADVPITRRGEETTFITSQNIPLSDNRLMISVVWDVTERKRVEDALYSEKELLDITLASIGDGVITTDARGRILSINPVAEELTGWSQDRALGRSLEEVFHIINQQTRETCENPFDKVMKSGGIVVGMTNHTVLLQPDGNELIIDDSGAPIRNMEGDIVGIVLVFRDVTERERMQKSLQNAQKLEAIGVLAGGIAHDFNNLLGGIFGYIDLASIQANGNKSLVNTLSKVMDVLDRAKKLTQRLLTFSKGGEPVRRIQSLATCVRKSVTFALSGSNISPIFAIPKDSWLCDFDENQMGQVLENITINARQSMPMGGKLDIAVKNIPIGKCPGGLSPTDYVCVSISDQGFGIAEENLSRIFDPFFTTKRQGRGLGLAVCHSIVRKHDGRIDVTSEVGRGSTFHIYLPASFRPLASDKPNRRNEHHGSGKILIMDDEQDLREILSLLLEKMGYCVDSAKDGDEAIGLARDAITAGQPYVVAILDLKVPCGRGGRETAQALLELDSNLKVIASSGYSEDPIMSNPTRYGFAARLIKPYGINDLSLAIESMDSHPGVVGKGEKVFQPCLL